MRVRLIKREGRKRKDGTKQTSLMLRWWNPDTKKYEHETLNFHLSNDPKMKQQNADYLNKADMLRIQKEGDLTAAIIGDAPLLKRKMPFVEYFKSVAKNKGWNNVLVHIKTFGRRNTAMYQIREDFVKDLRDHILSRPNIKDNTANRYYAIIKACLNTATKERILQYNPAKNVDGIKVRRKKPESLSQQEIELLARTPLKNTETKRAFLFSCLTGLRYSDLKKLTFGNIDFNKKCIVFVQQKTGEQNEVALVPEAMNLALEKVPSGTIPHSSLLVFPDLGTPQVVNTDLKKWQPLIKKNLHFHLSRATFASLCYEATEDIYSIMKALGHTQIATTEKYLNATPKRVASVVFKGVGHIKIKKK